jgi:hypothetical protein
MTAINAGERVDRLPVPGIWPWAEARERWVREGLPAEADHNALLDLTNDDFRHLPLNLNMVPAMPIKVLDLGPDYVTLIDEFGVTKRCLRSDYDRSGGFKTAAGAMSAMSQWIDFPVKDLRSWQAIREARFQPTLEGRLPAGWSAVEHAAEAETRWVGFFCFPLFGLFGPLRELMGLEGLLFAMYDTPALVRTIIDDLTDFWLDTFALVLPAARLDQVTFFEDMCATKGPLCGPALFREFLAPGYRKVIGGLRALGVSEFWMDTDGNAWDLLPELLACGITGTSPCEAQADMDVARLREAFPTLNLGGGIDKRALVTDDDAVIDAEIARCYRVAWERGRYSPSLDHGAPPDISWRAAQRYAAGVKRGCLARVIR